MIYKALLFLSVFSKAILFLVKASENNAFFIEFHRMVKYRIRTIEKHYWNLSYYILFRNPWSIKVMLTNYRRYTLIFMRSFFALRATIRDTLRTIPSTVCFAREFIVFLERRILRVLYFALMFMRVMWRRFRKKVTSRTSIVALKVPFSYVFPTLRCIRINNSVSSFASLNIFELFRNVTAK